MFIPSTIHPVSLNGTQLFKWRFSILFATFTGSLAATLSNLSSSSTPITQIYAQHDKITPPDNTANYKANKDMFLPRNRIIFSRSLLGFSHMSKIRLSTVVLDAKTPTRSNTPSVTERESFHLSRSLAGPDTTPLNLRTILQARSTTSTNLRSLIPFIIFGAILGTSVLIGLASVILWHFRKSKKNASTRLPLKNQPWDLSPHAYRLSRHMARDQRLNCVDIDHRHYYDTKNRTRLHGVNGTSISSRSIMSDHIDLEQRSPRYFHYNASEDNYHSSLVSDYINKSDSRAKPEDWLTDLKKKLEPSQDWRKKTKESVNRCSSFLNITHQNIQSQMEHHHKLSSKKKRPAGIQIDEFDDSGWSYDQLPDFFHASNCETPGGTNIILTYPLPRPQAATPKTNSCMADICREQSPRFSTHPTDSETETTTHLSLIAPTHDTYRDTMSSISFTTNERRDKGWSDPFDLDMPEFRRTCEPTNYKHISAGQSPPFRNLSGIDNKTTPTFI